jgi:N,N'-diacetyllegionaminate synthase
MSKREIILIGAGGHAVSCIDVIESDGRFRIAGLVGLEEDLGQRICGYEVIASDNDLGKLASNYEYAIVTIGQIKSPKNRIYLYNLACSASFILPTIVSPEAYVSKYASIGAGTIVMHGATVNAKAILGENCIINSHSIIEHGVHIGDHCHISTGVILNGGTRVGSNSFIGSGTLSKEGVSVGENCIVNLGSVIRRDIPDHTTYLTPEVQGNVTIIAEAGVNHNGDMNLARKLIDAAAMAGADIVKFQTFTADRLVTKNAVKAEYQIDADGSGESQYRMLQRLELDTKMHKDLFEHAKMRGIEFLSTAFDEDSVDFLAQIGLRRFKVPSGEINHLAYLRRMAAVAEEIIISTGMATLSEIGAAISVFEAAGIDRRRITLLHCTTEYPANIDEVNISAMRTMAQEFGTKVGYSDHTQGIEIATAAVALGASVVEKHFTLDKTLPGPDHKASLDANELREMVVAIRNVTDSFGDGIKRPTSQELMNIPIVRKSLVAKLPIRAGEIFSTANILAKRPGTGISPMLLDEVVGRMAPRDFAPDEMIEL